ncbi:MAG: hypothetical protein ACYS6W_11525 [Planctomycetota bacterium]|jgi:hypothetical protein
MGPCLMDPCLRHAGTSGDADSGRRWKTEGRSRRERRELVATKAQRHEEGLDRITGLGGIPAHSAAPSTSLRASANSGQVLRGHKFVFSRLKMVFLDADSSMVSNNGFGLRGKNGGEKN